MKLELEIVDKLFKENGNESQRFDNTFMFKNNKYHYFVNNYLFQTQIYRVYSLLAREVGISSAKYDYIRKNGRNLLYSKSIIQQDEELIESDFLDENIEKEGYYDYIKLWIDVIDKLPFKDKEDSLKEFYRQWFFALAIFDDDKQISLIKDSQGLYRVGEYFDYGGVYMNQDVYDIDNDVFYDEQECKKFCAEHEYTKEDLDNDLEDLIQKHVIKDIRWKSQCDGALEAILPHVDSAFIEKCFSVDILEIMDRDIEHHYSDNFRKVVSCMIDTSRSLLKEKLQDRMKVESKNKRGKRK